MTEERKQKPEHVDAQKMDDELNVLRGIPTKAQDTTELLKAGMALVKLENNTQMQMAVLRPRDEELVLKKCLAELKLYPDMAGEAVYIKPVGKNDSGIMQYAEGLSIRAAESLAGRWRNCAYGAEPIEDDGETFTIGVVFLDYETNVRAVRLGRISRKYKKSRKKGGGFAYHSEDRFNDIVVPAKQSKILRECILRALPSGLTKAYLKRAQELMNKQFTPAQQKMYREKLVKKFAELKVTEEQLDEILGKALNMGITENELTKLRGIYNALRDGETTIEQLIADRKGDLRKTQTASAEEALLAAQAQASEAGEKTSEQTTEPATEPPVQQQPSSDSPEKESAPVNKKSEKPKKATSKQKLVKTLVPLAIGNIRSFNKAVKQALGGILDANLSPEVALNQFTQKQLEQIDEAIKNPKPEKTGTETPEKGKEAAPEQKESEKPKTSEGNPEKTGLVRYIKEHGSSVENKIGIISEVVGSDVNDQALADMVDNPGLIEDIAHLRSVKNILGMMSE